MSRTHAHRPAWVWMTLPEYVVEVHDHRHDTCSLPSRDRYLEELRDGSRRPGPGGCRFSLAWNRMPSLCSCEMCSAGTERRLNRRAERRTVRQQLRAGQEPSPRRPRW
jgi:hypothetical protein